MKKNNMLRIASVLLVAVLLSTCAISGVFANYYTTIDDASDNAQVAKWGVKLSQGDNFADGLFDTEYAKTDDTFTKADNTVVTSSTWNLVAPGTGDTWTAFKVEGKPEVAVRLSYTATVDLGDNWLAADGTSFYCPVVFTVTNANGDETIIKQDATNTDADKLAAAIEAALEKATADYAANTDLSTAATFPTIAWDWTFGTNSVDDTALGDAAAAGTPATISITVGAEITQID